jgi:hypothetical protein
MATIIAYAPNFIPVARIASAERIFALTSR